jgi:hypothetical protein
MMLISTVILILSTFIQGTISNYLGYNYNNLTLFYTIYVLIALLILNPYFENKKKYFTLLIVFGLITDIAYTNTFLLNTCLFIICYYLSKIFHFFFPYNWLTISLSNLLSISVYHIISYIFLTILRYDTYSLSALLKVLSHSILMTIIYSNIVYVVLILINKKFQIKEVK